MFHLIVYDKLENYNFYDRLETMNHLCLTLLKYNINSEVFTLIQLLSFSTFKTKNLVVFIYDLFLKELLKLLFEQDLYDFLQLSKN